MYPLLIGIVLLIGALVLMKMTTKQVVVAHKPITLEPSADAVDVCPALNHTDCLTAKQCHWCASSGMCMRATNAALCVDSEVEGFDSASLPLESASDLGPGRIEEVATNSIDTIIGSLVHNTKSLFGIESN